MGAARSSCVGVDDHVRRGASRHGSGRPTVAGKTGMSSHANAPNRPTPPALRARRPPCGGYRFAIHGNLGVPRPPVKRCWPVSLPLAASRCTQSPAVPTPTLVLRAEDRAGSSPSAVGEGGPTRSGGSGWGAPQASGPRQDGQWAIQPETSGTSTVSASPNARRARPSVIGLRAEPLVIERELTAIQRFCSCGGAGPGVAQPGPGGRDEDEL